MLEPGTKVRFARAGEGWECWIHEGDPAHHAYGRSMPEALGALMFMIMGRPIPIEE